MKILVLTHVFVFSAIVALSQSSVTGQNQSFTGTERMLRTDSLRVKAIDDTVRKIQDNKTFLTEKYNGQIRDSSGVVIGSYEAFFNVEKESGNPVSIIRIERGEEEAYFMQCYFSGGKLIRIDVATQKAPDGEAAVNTNFYYDKGQVIYPRDKESKEVLGKIFSEKVEEILSLRKKNS